MDVHNGENDGTSKYYALESSFLVEKSTNGSWVSPTAFPFSFCLHTLHYTCNHFLKGSQKCLVDPITALCNFRSMIWCVTNAESTQHQPDSFASDQTNLHNSLKHLSIAPNFLQFHCYGQHFLIFHFHVVSKIIPALLIDSAGLELLV